MKFADYSRRWRNMILTLKKPATQASMSSYVRKLDKYLGNFELNELTEDRIQQHISLIAKDVSARSVWNYWGTLRLILNRAKREGLIQAVPEPVLPKKISQPQPYLTLEEMRVLSKLDPLYFLLSETGLRIGEALGLKMSDIDFKNQTLTVNRSVYHGSEQTPKTQNAFRTISISTPLSNSLSCLDCRSGFIFVTRNNTPQRQNQALRGLAKRFASTNSRVLSGFHSFRRANATILAKLGCPLKTISHRHGRATGDITVDTYIQYSVGSDREFAEQLGQLLIGG